MKDGFHLKGENRARAISIFSARLKKLRKDAGLIQKELAWELGVSRPHICHWERGKFLPTFYYLKKIALMFNVSVEDLIGDLPVKKKKKNPRIFFNAERLYCAAKLVKGISISRLANEVGMTLARVRYALKHGVARERDVYNMAWYLEVPIEQVVYEGKEL